MTDKWYDKAKKSDTPKGKTRHGSLSKAAYRKMIRKMCLHCCSGCREEVENCQASDCPLWSARMGTTKPEEPGTPPYPPLDCV
jgi:hypothetical protein